MCGARVCVAVGACVCVCEGVGGGGGGTHAARSFLCRFVSSEARIMMETLFEIRAATAEHAGAGGGPGVMGTAFDLDDMIVLFDGLCMRPSERENFECACNLVHDYL